MLADAAGCVLLRRRPASGLLGGMMELPGTEWRLNPWPEQEALVRAPMPAAWRPAGEVRHGFTHFELRIGVYAATVLGVGTTIAATKILGSHRYAEFAVVFSIVGFFQMLLDLTVDEFEQLTGWEIKPEGACQGEVCVALPPLERDADGRLDALVVAGELGMPIAHDDGHGMWAFGPRSGDRKVLDSNRMPELVLPDFDGGAFDVASLRGRKVVLYFYQKDDTPGCTKEACSFRDSSSEFERRGIKVLGVSLDDERSHRKFADKYKLPFTLLADTDHAVADLYGVYGEKQFMGRKYMGVSRKTFLIDEEGRLRKVFDKVNVDEHADEVLAAFE